ncbi:MAG TPA: serine/threonine-protein kinase [Blastocatellia bacterium]|nr:serine/threonine-protein kinase [Blastocatellia bacterium]
MDTDNYRPGGRDSLIGCTLEGKYLVLGRVGSGAMCNVYRARNIVTDKQVALKVLKPELTADPDIARRFEQEARAASRIHHPHAINVMDFGVAEDLPRAGDNTAFIVMELLDGETLSQLLRRTGPLGISRAAQILRQVAGALEAAHSVGVVHRDIKPDNIIITRLDGSDFARVVDFGVSKILEDVNRRGLSTAAHFFVGTPRYMSPEQCEERPADTRSDIYSLGVVLYEMLSGAPPFEGDSGTRLLIRHASEPPPPLRERRPDVSPEVEAVVMSALEKDPSRRPQGAMEFSRQFDRAAGTELNAQPAGGAFSRIRVPLVSEGEEEATLVSPRNRSSAASRGAGSGAAGVNRGQASASREGGPYSADNWPRRVPQYESVSAGYRERGNGGLIAAVIIILLVVAGVAAYLVLNSPSTESPGGDSITGAQTAIADALARLDSLPKDHPLRTYIPQLNEWQGELRAYSQVKEQTPQMKADADRYRTKAEQISDQARAALAALSRTANQNSNANANISIPPSEIRSNAAENRNRAADSEPPEEPKNRNERLRPPPARTITPIPPPPEPRPSNSNRGGQ